MNSHNLISLEQEMCEVLNAFPILKIYLKAQLYDISDVKERENVGQFFKRKNMNDEEIQIILKKLNHEIKEYLKN